MDAPDSSLIERLRRFDERRPSLPGEHWLSFGLGLYLLLAPRRSGAGKLAAVAIGAAFIARALSGRDGPLAALKQRQESPDTDEFREIAATWPYRDRVRITRPRRLLHRAT